jgi:membrane protein
MLRTQEHDQFRSESTKAQTIAALNGERKAPSPPHLSAVEPGFFARNFWLLRRAIVAAAEDNCFSIAKGAAYSFLLSLFPILTTITFLLAQAKAQRIALIISAFIRDVAPPQAEELLLSPFPHHGSKPVSLSIFAVVLSIWAGSGAMMSLMEGFQAAYHIPSGRPFFKQRAMAIFLVFIAAFPAIAASALIIFGEGSLLRWILATPEGEEVRESIRIVWRISRYVAAFATTTFVTGLLYYFGPNHRPEQRRVPSANSSRFMRVWPGAIVATVLWLIATGGFAAYVTHFSHYNVFYGSLGAVVILLFWLYLIAAISLIGCEFNAERERIEAMPLS